MWFVGWLIGAVLVGFAGTNRRMGFWGAFALGLLLTPIVAIIIVIGAGHKHPRGCSHCGNKENEAEFCALCGKDASGNVRSVT